jgi:polysaccharide biosynthesis transport protein
LLVGLRGAYDSIVIDSPPLLPVTDAATLAPATDGVVLVCRYKETTRQQVAAAAAALRAVSAPLLGTVLTMTPTNRQDGYTTYASYRPYQPDSENSREIP